MNVYSCSLNYSTVSTILTCFLVMHQLLYPLFIILICTIGLSLSLQAQTPLPELANIPNSQARNVIFILSDDHRYDFMSFTGKVPWLETPNMDRLASEGAHFPNAFVTTSLCSPSRASILTGLFSHSHTVVDNQAPDPGNLIFFPQYLQRAGYETAYVG